MKLPALILCVLLALACAPAARAERLGSLLPDSTLDDVRALYSGATATDVLEPWMGPHDRLVRFTGAGIDGAITVQLQDRLESNRALWLELLQAKSNTPPKLWDKQAYLELVEDHVRQYKIAGGNVWEVVGARWSPARPLALGEVEVRYGRDYTTTLDASFEKRIVWPGRRLSGVVGDGGMVDTLVYGWTLEDRECALDWRRGRDCEAQARARNAQLVKRPVSSRPPVQAATR